MFGKSLTISYTPLKGMDVVRKIFGSNCIRTSAVGSIPTRVEGCCLRLDRKIKSTTVTESTTNLGCVLVFGHSNS